MIQSEGVGRVCTDNSVGTLKKLAEELADEFSAGMSNTENCYSLSKKLFSPKTAVEQIVSALEI